MGTCGPSSGFVGRGRFTTLPNLLLRAALAEARDVMDPAGNWRLTRNAVVRERIRTKGDALAGAILGIAEGLRYGGQPCHGPWRHAGVA